MGNTYRAPGRRHAVPCAIAIPCMMPRRRGWRQYSGQELFCMAEQDEPRRLRDDAETRHFIEQSLNTMFAPEDDALRAALAAASAHDMPSIQISPVQGRLLQVLAHACGARKILEIGALAGYSGIWLARALPPGGRMISLEVSEKHAQVARDSLARAGLSDRAEVRVGPADELLPALAGEAPFDLVFIDADKPG